jgi:hypothetical protein
MTKISWIDQAILQDKNHEKKNHSNRLLRTHYFLKPDNMEIFKEVADTC